MIAPHQANDVVLPPKQLQSGSVFKNVQALRMLAAMLVVFDHMHGELAKSDPRGRTFVESFQYFGQSGVDLFFVISGFIMVTTNWENFGHSRAGLHFILRRLVRIFPPYWIVLTPVAMAYLFDAKQLMKSHQDKVDLIGSFLLIPSGKAHLLDTSWTLSFELFFYLIFALFLGTQRQHLSRFLLCWALVQVLVTAFFHESRNNVVAFVSDPLPLEFIMGAFVGKAYRSRCMPWHVLIGTIGVLGGLSLWLIGAYTSLLSDPTNWRVLEFGLPAVCVVYGAVGWEMDKGSHAPSWTVTLGDASYSIYLWHSPVVIVLGFLATTLHVSGPIADIAWLVMTIGVVIASSLFAYRYLERPITSWLNSRIANLSFKPNPAAKSRLDNA